MGLSDWKQTVQRLTRRFGYDIFYFDRIRLMRFHGIETVLDVGANIGQYGSEMRFYGCRGRLISFEPLSDAYRQLQQRARGDRNWRTLNYALGEQDDSSEINVSANSMSSSLLGIRPEHVEAAPEAGYVRTESIQVHRLDTVFDQCMDGMAPGPLLLKLDTQGYEYSVLQGALNSLPKISGLQVEMSLSPLYDEEMLFDEMVPYIRRLGFTLMSVEPVLRNKQSGKVLAVDGIFYRRQ